MCVTSLPGVPAGGRASESAGSSPHPGAEANRGAAAALQGPAGPRFLPQDEGGIGVHTGTLLLIIVLILWELFMCFTVH